ncbi:MAG: isoprenyl transferase [Coxiellaceae bacterium]|jgi:undecaprenyl diphosphate synthase|nr:isoprenyl transferase [Coxiellaceae bacterium]
MKLPQHIAIIMDGNGRWAKKRGLPRIAGHKAGVESVRAVVKTCLEKKIEVLTLFAFSTENWERPKEEVNYLMGTLFLKVLEEEVSKLHKNNVCFQVIGDIKRLNKNLQQKIRAAEKLTKNNSALKLVIAISYSGRWDITEATRQLCKKIAAGKIKTKDITTKEVAKHICLHNLPNPDLLIRTSGEQRISNFMLWHLAYTELYFTDVLWPDFREKALIDALDVYENRIRRFGKCSYNE